MSHLVYYSSASGNTARFIERLGLPAQRLSIQPNPSTMIDQPFVLVCPTYADGEGRGAVPKSVITMLNHAPNRANLRGVIGSGNRNFGELYAQAGKVIAKKCQVPLLYTFELSGTEQDLNNVRKGLKEFWLPQQ